VAPGLSKASRLTDPCNPAQYNYTLSDYLSVHAGYLRKQLALANADFSRFPAAVNVLVMLK
jgi:hypothetical protein